MARRSKRRLRRNPMPRGAAIYLTNPRKRPAKKASKRRGRKGSAFSRIGFKRNGVAFRTNARKIRRGTGKGKRRVKGFRRNGVAFRSNGVAFRTNGRKGRHGTPRRRNGKGKVGLALFAPVTKLVRKIPFVGPMIAPILVPAALGALGLVGVHFALRAAAQYVPPQVGAYVFPIGYTLGGALFGAALQFVPMLDAKTKRELAGAMIVGGAAVDAFRYFGSADLPAIGDGGLYAVGAIGAMGADGDSHAILSAYSGVALQDAAYSGADLDSAEGEAAISGARTWASRFPFAKRVNRVIGDRSGCAGQHGHRWGWLIKLIGWDNFRALASSPPATRTAYIQQLRQYAMQQAQQIPQNADYGALIYAGHHQHA
jgi:hypothetical protein